MDFYFFIFLVQWNILLCHTESSVCVAHLMCIVMFCISAVLTKVSLLIFLPSSCLLPLPLFNKSHIISCVYFYSQWWLSAALLSSFLSGAPFRPVKPISEQNLGGNSFCFLISSVTEWKLKFDTQGTRNMLMHVFRRKILCTQTPCRLRNNKG